MPHTQLPDYITLTIQPCHLEAANQVDATAAAHRPFIAEYCPIQQALAERFPSPTYLVTVGPQNATICECDTDNDALIIAETTYIMDEVGRKLTSQFDTLSLTADELPQTVLLDRMCTSVK